MKNRRVSIFKVLMLRWEYKTDTKRTISLCKRGPKTCSNTEKWF